jgi:hypothetical protein
MFFQRLTQYCYFEHSIKFMKKYLFCLLLLGIASFASAQCVKKYKMTTERTHEVMSDGSEGNEIPLSANITLSKDSINIIITTPDGNEITLKGVHKETVCKMNADYSEGTIEFKTDAELNHSAGESRQAKMLFKLESKAGKFKLYGSPEDQQTEKVCFVIKDKEEVK